MNCKEKIYHLYARKMKTFKTSTTVDINIIYVFTNESYFYSVEMDDNCFYSNSTEFYSL